MDKTLTVFTATYNRAYCLNKCYDSLRRQTLKDFTWLIIDDGFSDETSELVKSWKLNDNGFDIKYVYKENGGMHTAHNLAYEIITTELNVSIDSDDYLTDNAVELIINLWQKKKKSRYSGIVALDIFTDGNIVGNKLPNVDSIRLNDYYYHGGKGDKKLIYRTDVVKRYPEYPVFEGEKFVPLGIKYTLIDRDYELLVLNEPICVVEYMQDGSTKNIYRQYLKNPKGFAYARKFYMIYGIGFTNRFKSGIHYVSSSLITKNWRFIHESPKKIMTILAIPGGLVLFLFLKYKNRLDKLDIE